MAFEKVSENLHRLKESIEDFAKSSTEYYKLDLFYKAMKGTTAAVKTVAVIFCLVFALLFLSIAISVALSDWLDSGSSGFFIVGGLYLLISLLIIYFGSSVINRIILPTASRKFFNDSEKDQETNMSRNDLSNFDSKDVIIEEDERV